MLLPETATLRPYFAASSMIFCTRWTLEEKVAMMILPLASLKMPSRVSPTLFSDGVKPAAHVGAVRQHDVYAASAHLREFAQVDGLSVDGRVVDLEVAGVEQCGRRRLDIQADGVRDRMGGADGLHLKFSHLELLARFDRMEIGAKAVFLQLVLDKAQGQPGAVDWYVDLLQQIRHAADMVLMAVGDDHADDLGGILDQIAEVRNDHVDAVHFLLGKGHTAVDHQNLILVFQNGQILADFIEATDGNDLQVFRFLRLLCRRSLYRLLRSFCTVFCIGFCTAFAADLAGVRLPAEGLRPEPRLAGCSFAGGLLTAILLTDGFFAIVISHKLPSTL